MRSVSPSFTLSPTLELGRYCFLTLYGLDAVDSGLAFPSTDDPVVGGEEHVLGPTHRHPVHRKLVCAGVPDQRDIGFRSSCDYLLFLTKSCDIRSPSPTHSFIFPQGKVKGRSTTTRNLDSSLSPVEDHLQLSGGHL